MERKEKSKPMEPNPSSQKLRGKQSEWNPINCCVWPLARTIDGWKERLGRSKRPPILLHSQIHKFICSFRRAQTPLGLLLIALLLLGRFAPSFDSIKRRELASQKKATNPHATTATNKEREPNPLSLFGLLAG